MTTCKTLKLQQLIIESIEEIDFLKTNGINAFSSIPAKRKMPYIKIAGISLNKNQNSCNIKTFTIDLFIATNWKDNQEIIKIMNEIDENIATKIEQTKQNESYKNINIYNAYNNNYEIKEDLLNGIWCGHFYLDVDLI